VSVAPRLGPMLMRGDLGLGEALEKKQLERTGFRYVTLQRGRRARLRPYFAGIEPVYADAVLEAWRIDTMLERARCW
jgi:hypothetical protein